MHRDLRASGRPGRSGAGLDPHGRRILDEVVDRRRVGCRRSAVGHAARVGDTRIEAEGLGIVALAAAHGPTPVEEGIRRCEDILAVTNLRRSAQARVLRFLGLLRTMAGDVPEGAALVDRSMAMCQELGLQRQVGSVWQVRGLIDELKGDYTEAVRAHRKSFDLLTSVGDTCYASTAAGLLARALHALGSDDEAATMARVSRETASPDDLDTQVQWRLAEAGILAGRGDVEDAERLAQEALDLSSHTDLELRGDVLATLGEVAVAAGRTDEAQARFMDSVRAHQRKGNELAAAAVQARLAVLARSAP